MLGFLITLGSACFVASQVALFITGMTVSDWTRIQGNQDEANKAVKFIFCIYFAALLITAILWGLAR